MIEKTKSIDELHNASFENEVSILISESAGCFICLETFDPDGCCWLKEKSGRKTALCPCCGSDSVIGSSIVHPLPPILEIMNLHYTQKVIQIANE